MATIAPPFPTETTAASRLAEVDFDHLPFGTLFSDHMLVASYENGAWSDAVIRPYGPLPLAPTVSSLQYAISAFEGFKVFRTIDNEIAAFRPDDNWRRMNATARRMVLPEVPRELFIDGLGQLLDLDRQWVPSTDQGALYVRPTLFSVDNDLRVRPAESLRFVIATCPVGEYYAGALGIQATEQYVRAFPGGTGHVKPSGNYAGSLLAMKEAQQAGYQSVLWLDAIERRYVEECGVMNVVFVLGDTAVTPSLDGTILPGITRGSVLQLLGDFGIAVEERRVAIDEVLRGAEDGTLIEAFGVGTAATVASIGRLGYRGRDVRIATPVPSLAARLRAELAGIQSGRMVDRHGWLMRI